MNSYNENLHATIATSLQSLDVKQNSSKSSLNAAMFTLYYKEGDRITAYNKLNAASEIYAFQQTLKLEAVNNSNISVNVLNSANQQKKFTAVAITNAATCASNIQVLSNAVVRLSKDIAGIYTMLNAADYGTEIFNQSEIAHELMIETSYEAKKLSQLGREAASLTAAVSANNVAEEAKLTNKSISDLLDITTADFEASAKSLADYNTALTNASAVEKNAEGNLEFINVDYFATKYAYQLSNKVFNLDLKIISSHKGDENESTDNNAFTVKFNHYRVPFVPSRLNIKPTKPENDENGYPVKNYYIMLVKESNQSMFSLSTAESLLLNDRQFINVPHVQGKDTVEKVLYTSSLLDSDGDAMEIGEKYVVFVYAVLSDDYKKLLSCYDDFLSAPSLSFALTNKLAAPLSRDIHHKDGVLSFEVTEKSNYSVEYRVMFLPDCTKNIKGMLTEKGLRMIEDEVEKQEKQVEKYAPILEELSSEMISIDSTIDSLNEQRNELSVILKNTKDAAEIDKLKSEEKRLNAELVKLQKAAKENKAKLKQYNELDMQNSNFFSEETADSPGFFFNQMIAEKVSSANFLSFQKPDQDETKHGHTKVKISGSVTIDENTTDNFGNPLVEGQKYIPVILSYADVENNISQFTNALSPFAKPITYETILTN